jgi:hypothetical protein
MLAFTIFVMLLIASMSLLVSEGPGKDESILLVGLRCLKDLWVRRRDAFQSSSFHEKLMASWLARWLFEKHDNRD